MLALDDPAWARLTDAYGPAVDVPPMLRRLATAPSASLWEELWSALCHQHDVYPATYAALPHIVALAAKEEPRRRGEHLNFIATALACASPGAVPRVDPDLAPGYGAAVAAARSLALETLAEPTLSPADLAIAAAALAAARGEPAMAFDFLNAGEPLTCPVCDARVPSWGEYLTT